MAEISIDWATHVIFVPRDYMTLVQVSPTEIRELDLNDFRYDLKALEASVYGMPNLKTHKHTTEVTLGGAVYARVIEILPPYTVTFEDGQYAVNLVGANSNVGDRVNVNQVSVRSNNSAGLISGLAIEFGEYDNGVVVDAVNGVAGQPYPIGTARRPSNNMTDAKVIADLRGFKNFYFSGDFTIDTGDYSDGYRFSGLGGTLPTITLTNSAYVANCRFEGLNLEGTQNGAITAYNCTINASETQYFGIQGVYVNSFLLSQLYISSTGIVTAILHNCAGAGTLGCHINMLGPNHIIVGNDLTGAYIMQNFQFGGLTPTYAQLGFSSGTLEFDSSCVGGVAQVLGVVDVTDNSGPGCVVIDTSINQTNIIGWSYSATAAYDPPTRAEATSDKTEILNRIGVPISLDSGGATLSGMLTKMADDNAGADFDATYDSLNKISDKIDQAIVNTGVPQTFSPDIATRIIGDDDGGSVGDLNSHDESFMDTGEVTGTGLEVVVDWTSTGIEYSPSLLRITGYYNGSVGHYINVSIYNYTTAAYEQKFTMLPRTSSFDYITGLTSDNCHTSTGEASIKFKHVAATYNPAHVLRLDWVSLEKIEVANSLASDVADIKSQTDKMQFSILNDIKATLDGEEVIIQNAPTNFDALSITSTGRVDVASIEGLDATDQIRDAIVDDATRIDASALNAASKRYVVNAIPLIPALDLSNLTRTIGVWLTTNRGTVPSSSEISAGFVSIYKKAKGDSSWTPIRVFVSSSKVDGIVYYNETFNSANFYAEGDTIEIRWHNITVTIDGETYHISDSTGLFVNSHIREIGIKETYASLPDNFDALSITSTGRVDVEKIEGIDATDQIQSSANAALVAQRLDHLLAVADSDDVVNNSVIAKLAASDGDWSGFNNTSDSLEAIRDRGDIAWITGGGGGLTQILNVQPLIPKSMILGNTIRLGLMLVNALDDLPSAAEITPGTISIDRQAPGDSSWSSIRSDVACSEAAGIVYYDETFDTSSGYAEGDSIRITLKSQSITADANTHEITSSTGISFYTELRQIQPSNLSNLTITSTGGVDVEYIKGLDATDQIEDTVWDTVLTGASHNSPTTSGRRLRDIATSVIITGISPDSGGTTNNSIRIELNSDASSMDGAYDPAVINIVNGTGAGQSRQIFEYDGANKLAYINRDWKVIPDNTSEYVIMANSGNAHVNEGLVGGATSTGMTLNTLASTQDDAYKGQLIFIVAGVGQDQVQRVKSYDGATRTATIEGTWDPLPVNGQSIYVMLPDKAFTSDEWNTTINAIINSNASIEFLLDVEGGDWELVAPNKLYFYEAGTRTGPGTGTIVAEFDCYDIDGNDTITNIARVERV